MKTNFIIDITYSELLNRSTNNYLMPGQKYRITDLNNILVIAESTSQYIQCDQGGLLLQNQIFG